MLAYRIPIIMQTLKRLVTERRKVEQRHSLKKTTSKRFTQWARTPDHLSKIRNPHPRPRCQESPRTQPPPPHYLHYLPLGGTTATSSPLNPSTIAPTSPLVTCSRTTPARTTRVVRLGPFIGCTYIACHFF